MQFRKEALRTSYVLREMNQRIRFVVRNSSICSEDG
jgi:hypothetical protein